MRTDRGNGRRGVDPRELSTAELMGRMAGDVGTLVRKEVELARRAALLIVAGVFLPLAAASAVFGRARLKQPVAPEQAKRTIREDVEWAKAQLRR